jgi:hypothetical protein
VDLDDVYLDNNCIILKLDNILVVATLETRTIYSFGLAEHFVSR